MFDNGLLKHADDGSVIPVTDPAEMEHIRSEVARASKQKQDQMSNRS